MKTIEIKLYSFSELSKEAQNKAINDFHNNQDFDYIWHEAEQTVEEFCKQTNVRTGNRSWLEFNINNIDDAILELTGNRLRTYFINNFTFLYKAKYLKTFTGHKKHRMIRNRTTRTGEYCSAYSNIQKERNNCNLTGVCYDEDFLAPIYNFIDSPNSNETFQDVISDCFESLRKSIENEIEYQTSSEAIIEQLNESDEDFEQDGSRSKY